MGNSHDIVRTRHGAIITQTRKLILDTIRVEAADDTSLMLTYGDFYLQITFSALHPLMIIYAARAMPNPAEPNLPAILNEQNLRYVLGSCAINTETGCFTYRATQWLDAELSRKQFLEMLNRCLDEASRGYARLYAANKGGLIA